MTQLHIKEKKNQEVHLNSVSLWLIIPIVMVYMKLNSQKKNYNRMRHFAKAFLPLFHVRKNWFHWIYLILLFEMILFSEHVIFGAITVNDVNTNLMKTLMELKKWLYNWKLFIKTLALSQFHNFLSSK